MKPLQKKELFLSKQGHLGFRYTNPCLKDRKPPRPFLQSFWEKVRSWDGPGGYILMTGSGYGSTINAISRWAVMTMVSLFQDRFEAETWDNSNGNDRLMFNHHVFFWKSNLFGDVFASFFWQVWISFYPTNKGWFCSTWCGVSGFRQALGSASMALLALAVWGGWTRHVWTCFCQEMKNIKNASPTKTKYAHIFIYIIRYIPIIKRSYDTMKQKKNNKKMLQSRMLVAPFLVPQSELSWTSAIEKICIKILSPIKRYIKGATHLFQACSPNHHESGIEILEWWWIMKVWFMKNSSRHLGGIFLSTFFALVVSPTATSARHEYCNKTGTTLCAGGGLYSF